MIEFTQTKTDKNNSDEFYTPEHAVNEHIRVSEEHLNLTRDRLVATCFGTDNIYTKILREKGYNVVEFSTFEDLLETDENIYLIDNPPFSTANKDRKLLEENNIDYSLFGSGTRLPKSHKYGCVLLKQPRIKYHNGIEVLTSVFSNQTNLVISEYKRKLDNKYNSAFIAVNLKEGAYTKDLLRDNGMNI